MRRNFDAVRNFISRVHTKCGEMDDLEESIEEHNAAGYGGDTTDAIHEKYQQANSEYHQINNEVLEEIRKIPDKSEQYVLIEGLMKGRHIRYLCNRLGCKEKRIRNIRDRGLLDLEAVLLHDGYLKVQPQWKNDLQEDYDDGYVKGRSAGYSEGYDEGYDNGHRDAERGYDKRDEYDEEDTNTKKEDREDEAHGYETYDEYTGAFMDEEE